ncbi:MAG: hypothetical protein HY400_00540 [Elusimicrobia bacterium]|nr:hypothetical protein [Elusimicrobiota bacterium]
MAGGVVRSDRWTVRREKQEEEFEGNVSYTQKDQEIHSDWALFKKQEERWIARGHVQAKRKFENGDMLNLKGMDGHYLVKDQSGQLTGNPLHLELQAATETYKATSLKANYSHAYSVLELSRDALTEGRPIVWQKSPDWTGAVEAEKVLFTQEPSEKTHSSLFAEKNVKGWVYFPSKTIKR